MRLPRQPRGAGGTPWVPVWSPAAALRGLRAAIVVAGSFAFADQVLGNLQIATFAAFGGFATLVLAQFAGDRREKLAAHAVLAVAGSVLLTIGTAVHYSTALDAAITVPVTFAVFFAGIAGPNAASGATGALLAYILPAASPGSVALIPDRLAGWWLASVAGTASVLLLAPRGGGEQLRPAIAKLADALADELRAALDGGLGERELSAAKAANLQLRARFSQTPYRPTGLAPPGQALADSVEMLDWCATLISDAVSERADLQTAAPADRELLAASASVLGDAGSLLAGGDGRPDLERLADAHAQSLAALEARSRLRAREDVREAARVSFNAHAVALAALGAGADARVAAGVDDPARTSAERRRVFLGSVVAARAAQRVSSAVGTAARHASLRSIWFVNSLRGSIALAAAVAIAQLSSVQHGFWVVLGTLSVLRTSAAATGSTALRALAGTAIGFVVGGALLLAIGSHTSVLWAVLPVAVFVAAYTPGTAPFVLGQAAFTVTVAVLFNLLAPVGWKVGVLRIEDVAIGCAVSVVVGLLFWPRGITALVGDDLADVFRSGAAYLVQAVEWAAGVRASEPAGAAASSAAASRLDEALRGLLSEQGTKRVEMHELWKLVGGSHRLRLTARSIVDEPRDLEGIDPARVALERRTHELARWYEQLAELLSQPRGPNGAAPQPPAFGEAETVAGAPRSQYAIWLCEHLDHLAQHAAELSQPASEVAEARSRPWWR